MKEYRHVFDILYVGGHESSKKPEKFDTIVSMAEPSEYTDYEYTINDGDHEYKKFKQAVDTIIDEIDSQQTVLVNCAAGLSRSVSVCVAVQVCYYKNIGYITAIQNARSNTRMPENELMRSAERYIKSSESTKIDVTEEIEYFADSILKDISNFEGDFSEKNMRLLIAQRIDEWEKAKTD